jgi:hypothetical protein
VDSKQINTGAKLQYLVLGLAPHPLAEQLSKAQCDEIMVGLVDPIFHRSSRLQVRDATKSRVFPRHCLAAARDRRL